jgi:hypothetical protein
MLDKRFAKSKDSLLDTNATTLDHDKVFLNNTIMREATKRGDALFSDVKVSGSALWVRTLSNSVDLLVDLSSMMITILTSTRNSELDSTRMPSSNTSNLKNKIKNKKRKEENKKIRYFSKSFFLFF